jgi:hypothetical protein
MRERGFRISEMPEFLPLAEYVHIPMEGVFQFYASGHTPLNAAIRCFVVSELGKTAEVPDELATEDDPSDDQPRDRENNRINDRPAT